MDAKNMISIIMPVYNGDRYIGQAIESCLRQSERERWELIIVNDGSTDDTARVIEPYLEDKRVKLVSQDNKGVSAARNRAIAHSRGNYIAFLDADDYYLPHTIKNYLEAIERTKGSLHSITATTCESTRKAK